jgi:hypothetical protein
MGLEIKACHVKVKIDDDETLKKRYKLQVKIHDYLLLHYGSDILLQGGVEYKTVTLKFEEFSHMIACAVEFGASCFSKSIEEKDK